EDSRYHVPWTLVDGGDHVAVGDDSLIVLRTPGHSPDHLAFWHEPSRRLFSGDLVVLGSSVMIHASRGGDLSDYLASLHACLALDPARLLPAHGAPIDDAKGVLTAYIHHRQVR